MTNGLFILSLCPTFFGSCAGSFSFGWILKLRSGCKWNQYGININQYSINITLNNTLALYVRECFDCLELNDGDDRVQCLWVRIRGKANKADTVVGVCYRPPNQDEEADEIFYKQLREVSQSLALVLMGTSTYQMSAGNTIQQRGNSLGGSWGVWKITS